ncbi:hypothetical protein NPX13_g10478 [Xylaria arbuscula]|uniref:Uncharacterized protein n=1 Tax=Xylaria arbuscula TaxID=114810 RepID=A0A9W8N4N2_9PEZI|nr:hypothetical protein NPX13_g10478 [Xylaria arbuscula]
MTMADREESDQPRKRIAVAVSSHERHLKDGGFPYSLEAARLGHQGAGPMSPLASMPPYAYDVGAADGLTSYRPSTYSYNDTGSTKHYYSTTQPWSSTSPAPAPSCQAIASHTTPDGRSTPTQKHRRIPHTPSPIAQPLAATAKASPYRPCRA